VQQEKRRRIFRAGLSAEDRESVNLDRAIKSRVFHGTFLSLSLGHQLKRCEHHENNGGNAGPLKAMVRGRRAEKTHDLPPRDVLGRY